MMEKFLKLIRANPEKAEKMVDGEEKEEKDGLGAILMRVRQQPPSMRSKRTAEKRVKMSKKKKQVSKQKKVEKTKKKDQHEKSKKGKSVKSKKKQAYNKRTLGTKGKRIVNKNIKLERKTKKKIKSISPRKKVNQKRKEIKRANKRKCHGKELKGNENSRDIECIDKWANYTSLALGLAPTVIKQVGKFSFSNHDAVSGQFHQFQR